MAARLDDLLAPGERVVWRTRWNWVPTFWPFAVLALALLGHFLLVSAHPNRVFGAIVLGLLLAVWLFNGFTRWQTAALVTERRVLYRGSYGETAVTDLALAKIEKLEGFAPPTAHLRGGATVAFHDIRQGRRLLPAISRAAGVPHRRVFVGPALDAGSLLGLALPAAAAGVLMILFELWLVDLGVIAELSPSLWPLALFLILPLATHFYLAGHYLVRAIAVAFLRPFVTAGEIADWLCLEAGRNEDAWAQRHIRPRVLAWAGWLYGQPIRCPAGPRDREAGG